MPGIEYSQITASGKTNRLRGQSLPGTLDDGFWQEPVDVIPVSSASAHVGYINGTLFVMDKTNSSDTVVVVPAGNGGAALVSNLGIGYYPVVTSVVTALGGGNNSVLISNLPGVTRRYCRLQW